MKLYSWKLMILSLTLGLVLLGCGGPAGGPANPVNPAQPDTLPEVIDVQTAQSLASREDVFILDVREDFEYAEGHIPGATLIPLGQLPDRLSEIPTDKTVVAVCRSGNRSGQATEFLRSQGLDNVHNMEGGMNAWAGAGYTVEK